MCNAHIEARAMGNKHEMKALFIAKKQYLPWIIRKLEEHHKST